MEAIHLAFCGVVLGATLRSLVVVKNNIVARIISGNKASNTFVSGGPKINF
jgi:cytochrome c biogenesis protein ResB